MSLTSRVADLVAELGGANVDQLVAFLPEYTRDQVINAMHNARTTGLIHCNGRVPRKGTPRNGSMPATYYPGPAPGKEAPKAAFRAINSRPPASAWELAHGLQIPGTWPPQFENGRQFRLLGPWTEEGAAA
jgi:hypothetical protein